MTIYSLYVFDRHCACVYYHDWHRTKQTRPAVEGGLLKAVSRAVAPRQADSGATAAPSTLSSPRNTLVSTTGAVVAVGEDPSAGTVVPTTSAGPGSNTLTFDEEAKLVYGVILSLRNMIKKLSRRDEQFTSYRTSAYKLHLYETLSGYKFVMLSDPSTDGLRFVLRQIYSGPFVDYVARNPLVPMDSREQGIDNEYFRASVDRMIRGLSVFA
ncbi:snare-like protein [Pisolithus thermaeus]|nr:snare-like protein [Pisolithus croceorrhizus]KAI6149977.1 snare-like protein [Pisolithus thermaeus]